MEQNPRDPVRDDAWRIGGSKPVGLYGELPPLPATTSAANAPSKAPALEREAID